MQQYDFLEYTLAKHWILPLTQGDSSELSEYDIRTLNSWKDLMPISGQFEVDPSSQKMTYDEITGLFAECYKVKLRFSIQENLEPSSVYATSLSSF